MSTPETKCTAKDWDEVRMGFQTSIMVDTPLSSLAQNLDAPDWPLPGREETPAKYVDLSFDDLRLQPGFNDHPERIDQLVAILRETLTFDNPFGDMVAQTAEAADRDNPLLKNMGKLGIPADYPIAHTMVSADTKEFCALEKITTLGEFAKFAQSMPPHVIVGGDFRTLLNALAHVNEEVLATMLPYRAGNKGVHLAEALGQLVGTLPAGQRLALYKRLGGKLKAPEADQAASMDKVELKQLEAGLQERAAPLLEVFAEERRAMQAALAKDEPYERQVAVLGDPVREKIVAHLLAGAGGAVEAEAEAPAEARHWWSFPTRWFKK
ncbi:MAG TPA: hypothetical protein VMF63_08090 [Opitutaceae bacterium]|nr:hypothetical protein [Opitutaceae bacterium]